MPSLLPTIHRLLRVHRLLLAAGALLSVAAIRLPGQSLATVPPSSSVHLTSCASETRTFRVCLSGTTAGKTDVYLLADTTGSMGEALSSVQSGANALLTAMLASPDIRVGVGRYQDFPVPANPYCFEHQLSPSNSIPAITAAINSWAAGNGIDTPEGQLFALHQLATSGTIGWRPGARRIIVWFGDAPGHDPVCTAISGAGANVTEASVTSELQLANTTVFAISLPAGGGLDANPASTSNDYGVCGAPGGTPGQATRICSATGGSLSNLLAPAALANEILTSIGGLLTSVDVSLHPVGPIAAFVTGIQPSVHHVTLPTNPLVQTCVDFTVTFTPNDATNAAGTMEARNTASAVLASLPYSVTAISCCTTPPPNMVGWWHDSTAGDIAGPVFNNGAWNLSALPSAGYVGTSGLMHASTNFVSVPDQRSLNFLANESFSIDLWVKPSTVFDGVQALVSKLSIGPAAYHTSGYVFYLDDGHPALALASSGVVSTYVDTSVIVPPGTWSHVAVTVNRKAPAGKFYFNGFHDSIPPTSSFTPITQSVGSFGTELRLGAFNHGVTTFIAGTATGGLPTVFDGETDEIELFRRALTSTEVAAIHGAGHAGKCQKGMVPPFPYADATVGPLLLTGSSVLSGVIHVPFPWGPAPLDPTIGRNIDLFVSTNGFVYLTAQGAPPPGNADGYSNSPTSLVNNFRNGGLRIAPYLKHLDLQPANNGGVHVKFDTNPDRVVITWLNAVEYGQSTPKTIQCQLLASGEVVFSYSDGMTVSTGVALCGVTPGGGVADPGALDLSASPLSDAPTLYQVFDSTTQPFDLAGTSLVLVPYANGYEVHADVIQEPAHTLYGSGCYAQYASLYELFPDAAAASARLQGNSMTALPSADGYTAIWNPGGGTASFVTPTTGAVVLQVGDDGAVTLQPSLPFPTPFGAESAFRVHGNGLVSLGASPQTFPGGDSYTPTPAAFLAAGQTAFWSWHDYNASEPGSGFVKYEEIGTTAYITWDGVESYSSPPIANPSTMQLQFDLATGIVTWVWPHIDTNSSSLRGSGHLVGFSPGGASLDPGSTHLPVALPFSTGPDNSGLSLSVASSAIPGGVVTYTTTNVPDLTVGAGLHVGLTIISFSQVPAPGVDLTLLGAPGCSMLLGSFDILFSQLGSLPVQSTTLAIPTSTPSGLQFFVQAAALASTANPIGIVTSNGIATTVP